MKEFDEARAFHKIKLTTKTGINHSSFEINQTLSSVIKQSGTHTRKIGIEQNRALDGKYVNIYCIYPRIVRTRI